ncbi:hypothetical protein [Kitasatospora sp. NPDC127060]|uniref:hypothetical protein n=1 Tax=Kitasatospora sp. NPDC127060 TaxID=3347121 RepID=UPI00364A1736
MASTTAEAALGAAAELDQLAVVRSEADVAALRHYADFLPQVVTRYNAERTRPSPLGNPSPKSASSPTLPTPSPSPSLR